MSARPFPRRLGDDEAQLWWMRPQSVEVSDALGRFGRWLSAEERARLDRFTFAEGRVEFLLTRALVRSVLGRYLGTAPGSLQFTTGPRGRPELVPSIGERRLRFNATNTQGFIGCIVAWEIDVGLDAEYRAGPKVPLDVAPRVFSAEELESLQGLPDEGQRGRFYELWTLKESYVKARGIGLGLPLRDITFDVADPVSVRFETGFHDKADDWQFERPSLDPAVAIAASLRIGSGARRLLSCFEWPGEEASQAVESA